MTARSTSRTPALGTVADAPRAGAARVGSATGPVFAISVALAMAIFGSSQAFAAGPASAVAAASSPAGEAANRFIVKPGQSLNDVATAVTQSHDRISAV